MKRLLPFTGALLGSILLAACGGTAPAAAPVSSAPLNGTSGTNGSASTKPVTSAAAPAPAKPITSSAAAASTKPAAGSTPASTKPAASGTAASSKPAASGFAAGAANLKHMDVALSSLSGDSIPVWVAQEGGYFVQNGLDVNLQLINGAAAAMATLISGKVQLGHLGGSAVLTSAAAGADVVVLGTGSPVIPYKFYVPPDVKSAQDLKGKKVDLGTVGSAVDVATKIGIAKLGLDPDKDVVYVTTGSHAAATTALMNGAIQGRMDNPPGSVELDARGFNVLLDMAAQKIPAANSTITVTKQGIAQNKDLLLRYVDSIVQGAARARADKAFTVKVIGKNYKSDDTKAMEAAYDFWTGEVIAPLPVAKVEQFADAKTDLAKTTPAVANLDVAKLIDGSFVQSAADRGLDKATL
jgi:NitT/TauT family transport system substrate-binding protein